MKTWKAVAAAALAAVVVSGCNKLMNTTLADLGELRTTKTRSGARLSGGAVATIDNPQHYANEHSVKGFYHRVKGTMTAAREASHGLPKQDREVIAEWTRSVREKYAHFAGNQAGARGTESTWKDLHKSLGRLPEDASRNAFRGLAGAYRYLERQLRADSCGQCEAAADKAREYAEWYEGKL